MSQIVIDLRAEGRTPPAVPLRGEHDVWVAAAREAAERAAAAQAAEATAVRYWAVLERGGHVYQKTTSYASVAQGWHLEERMRILESGEGPAPWERQQAPAAPTVATESRPCMANPVPDALPSSGGQTRPTADPVADFEAALSAVAAPTPANPGVVPEVAPAASLDVITDELIARVLAHLEVIKDTRIRTQTSRLRSVLAELRANGGRAVHPKYRIPEKYRADESKPF